MLIEVLGYRQYVRAFLGRLKYPHSGLVGCDKDNIRSLLDLGKGGLFGFGGIGEAVYVVDAHSDVRIDEARTQTEALYLLDKAGDVQSANRSQFVRLGREPGKYSGYKRALLSLRVVDDPIGHIG